MKYNNESEAEWYKVFKETVPFNKDSKKADNIYDLNFSGTELDLLKRIKRERETNTNARSEIQIIVGMDGIIPVWKKSVELKWRINKDLLISLTNDPVREENKIRESFKEAVNLWGTAAPIKFKEADTDWDFEILPQNNDCGQNGCLYSRAFYPHYPKPLNLIVHLVFITKDVPTQTQIFIHELGHIFGLRHYNAISYENHGPAYVFGEHDPDTAMSLSPPKRPTDQDKIDLKKFYEEVWEGSISAIDGTPVVQFPLNN